MSLRVFTANPNWNCKGKGNWCGYDFKTGTGTGTRILPIIVNITLHNKNAPSIGALSKVILIKRSFISLGIK